MCDHNSIDIRTGCQLIELIRQRDPLLFIHLIAVHIKQLYRLNICNILNHRDCLQNRLHIHLSRMIDCRLSRFSGSGYGPAGCCYCNCFFLFDRHSLFSPSYSENTFCSEYNVSQKDLQGGNKNCSFRISLHTQYEIRFLLQKQQIRICAETSRQIFSSGFSGRPQEAEQAIPSIPACH